MSMSSDFKYTMWTQTCLEVTFLELLCLWLHLWIWELVRDWTSWKIVWTHKEISQTHKKNIQTNKKIVETTKSKIQIDLWPCQALSKSHQLIFSSMHLMVNILPINCIFTHIRLKQAPGAGGCAMGDGGDRGHRGKGGHRGHRADWVNSFKTWDQAENGWDQ